MERGNEATVKISTIIKAAKGIDDVLKEAQNGQVKIPDDIAGDRSSKAQFGLEFGWVHVDLSVRVMVSLEVTCGSDPEEHKKAFDYSRDIVLATIAHEMERVKTYTDEVG